MKKIALAALMLTSSSAFATSTRVASHQGNLGLADGTDYSRLSSLTDDAGNNAWFDYAAGGSLAGAATWDGNGVSFAQGEDRVDFSWNNANGDTGYRVDAGISNMEALSVGGSYGMSAGGTDSDMGASVDMNGDSMGFGAHYWARALTDDSVTAYGAIVGKDDAGITIDGGYFMGNVFGSDASKAALTYGPAVGVALPDGGDMALDVSVVAANLAGEVTVKDWIGIRGSVAASLDLVDPTGELDLATSMSTGFGASINTDSVNIDLMLSPDAILGGPHFLTGAGTGSAAAFSARFDI